MIDYIGVPEKMAHTVAETQVHGGQLMALGTFVDHRCVSTLVGLPSEVGAPPRGRKRWYNREALRLQHVKDQINAAWELTPAMPPQWTTTQMEEAMTRYARMLMAAFCPAEEARPLKPWIGDGSWAAIEAHRLAKQQFFSSKAAERRLRTSMVLDAWRQQVGRELRWGEDGGGREEVSTDPDTSLPTQLQSAAPSGNGEACHARARPKHGSEDHRPPTVRERWKGACHRMAEVTGMIKTLGKAAAKAVRKDKLEWIDQRTTKIVRGLRSGDTSSMWALAAQLGGRSKKRSAGGVMQGADGKPIATDEAQAAAWEAKSWRISAAEATC